MIRYCHYKGGTYTLIAHATMEHDGAPVVVYMADADGRVWVRPAYEFHGTVLNETGAKIARFQLLFDESAV